MTDWTRPPPDSEPPDSEPSPGDEKAYESENDNIRLESQCPLCGVILTTLERGFDWHADLDKPLCEKCKAK